jgi:exopolyphosphatase/guanosine-5'-triphosphate,3'-diphosphate pyrophosphatase
MAEPSEVVAEGRSTRTIAIESEDAAAVVAAVHDVGLDAYVNTSYPVGLARLVDGEDPCFAVIDVGTNSVSFTSGSGSTTARGARSSTAQR